MHQVLHGDDPHQPLLIDNRNHAEAAAAEFAEGCSERVAALRDLEGAHHRRLYIAVAAATQRVNDTLFADDTDHIAAAHHREIVLEGVYGFLQRVFESVGG